MSVDVIQEYQAARQKHRQAELDITRAKAQIEIYQKEIANILKSENVASIEELSLKYQEELSRLKVVTETLNKETIKANEILDSLRVGQ